MTTYRKAPEGEVEEEWGDEGPADPPPAPRDWIAIAAFLVAGWGALIWYAGVVVGWWAL